MKTRELDHVAALDMLCDDPSAEIAFEWTFFDATGISHYYELIWRNPLRGHDERILRQLETFNCMVLSVMNSTVFEVLGEGFVEGSQQYSVPPDYKGSHRADSNQRAIVTSRAEFEGFQVRRVINLAPSSAELTYPPTPYLALGFQPVDPELPAFGLPISHRQANITAVTG